MFEAVKLKVSQKKKR